MIDTPPDSPSSPPGSRPVRRSVQKPGAARRSLLVGAVILLIAVLVLTGLLYLNRRAVAREVLVGWLDRRGVPADVAVERLELDGFTARVRIGPADDPDVTVEKVEVDYALVGPWAGRAFAVNPSRIRVTRPLIKARWREGKLSLGSLDGLLSEFAARPPGPDSAAPTILVESGRVVLDTEYGPIQVTADARMDDGRLTRLSARLPAAALRSGDVEAQAVSGALELVTRNDRMTLDLTLDADAFTAGGAGGRDARLVVAAEAPYPEDGLNFADGPVRLNATLTGGTLSLNGTQARDAGVRFDFDGRAGGWIDAFRLDGAAEARVQAARLTGEGLDLTGVSARWTPRLSAARDGAGLTWRGRGEARLSTDGGRAAGLDLAAVTARAPDLLAGGGTAGLEARGDVALTAGRLASGDLDLREARADLRLDARHAGAVLIRLDGSASATRAAWPLFGAPTPDDLPDLAEMKRALQAFALDAPGFSLTTGSPGTALRLTAPVTARPANGGVLTLAAAGRPVFEAEPGRPGGGALSLRAERGRGLPEAAFAVPEWRMTQDGFTARLDGRAALDFDLARGLQLTARGTLASAAGRLTLVTEGCADLSVERLEMGENDVTDITGRLCPGEAPAVTAQDGRWRAAGRIEDLSAAAAFLALRFDAVRGDLAAAGGPDGLGLQARVAHASVIDTTDPRRFNALTAQGGAELTDERWSGAFDLRRGAHGLGRLTLAHDGRSQAGGVVISAPSIVFTEDGLQPDDLSPLVADLIQSPATGSVAFEGRLDWTADGEGSSSGLLTVPNLDFVSPAGPVRGLGGTIAFTNLAPLTTAPDQTLRIAELDSVAPLTEVGLTFALDKAAVTVGGGELHVAGGLIRVEPFSVPLDRAQAFGGVVVLQGVQLGELIAGAGFQDKVQMDAVVSGRAPFVYDPARGGLRIVSGRLAADQPGRLSIRREALSGLEAGGGGEGVPPNTVQDLAYQAMENLAFDVLTAEVNSLDEGRLGVLFHIRGRHDPPQRQEIKLTWLQAIRQEYLRQTLPLPSDTGIDLTLDTTLNANQLFGDLLALDRARRGEDD